MKHSLQTHRYLKLRSGVASHSVRKTIALASGMSLLGVLSACGGISSLTEERVSQSETAVQQAQQTIGKSEHGAVELQQAREKLEAAKSALARKQETQAERSAAEAHLYAELAIAKSQSAEARKGANEVLAGLETLRQESERGTPTLR